MKSVNIARLKAELARYLRAVKDGEEVIVLDRQTPIARIVPYRAETRVEIETRKPLEDPGSLAKLRVPAVKGRRTDVVALLLEDRRRR